MSQHSLKLLRYSYAVLFFWFGFHQISEPQFWTGFLPEWIGYFPIPAEMIVRINGWFEIIAATALLLGVYTRIVSALLGAHLLFIAIEVGGTIGMRDGVLAMMGFALALSDVDLWTIDYKSKQSKS
ncbi:MAG: DoxX family protein [Candidatus Magasanikbacteria bacterium]|nr:DoxX family protein [Candidatus Magasanikbacteria bacterium]